MKRSLRNHTTSPYLLIQTQNSTTPAQESYSKIEGGFHGAKKNNETQVSVQASSPNKAYPRAETPIGLKIRQKQKH